MRLDGAPHSPLVFGVGGTRYGTTNLEEPTSICAICAARWLSHHPVSRKKKINRMVDNKQMSHISKTEYIRNMLTNMQWKHTMNTYINLIHTLVYNKQKHKHDRIHVPCTSERHAPIVNIYNASVVVEITAYIQRI